MKESHFQASLIKELKEMFKGCIVLKTDANYIQGFPDLLVLYKNKWVALECKRNIYSHRQPNQEYYVDMLCNMSFASFVTPENKEDVIREIFRTFES